MSRADSYLKDFVRFDKPKEHRKGEIWDAFSRMWHPDTPENRHILESAWWKILCLKEGPPARPLPRHVTNINIPATNQEVVASSTGNGRWEATQSGSPGNLANGN